MNYYKDRNTQLSNESTQTEDEESETQCRIESIQSEIETFDRNYKVLEDESESETQCRIESIQSEIETFDRNYKILEAKESKTQSRIESIQSEIETFDRNYKVLEAKESKTQSRIESIQSEIKKLNKNYKALKNEESKTQGKIESVQSEIETFDRNYKVLEKQDSTNQSDIKTMKKTISKLEENYKTLTAANVALEEKLKNSMDFILYNTIQSSDTYLLEFSHLFTYTLDSKKQLRITTDEILKFKRFSKPFYAGRGYQFYISLETSQITNEGKPSLFIFLEWHLLSGVFDEYLTDQVNHKAEISFIDMESFEKDYSSIFDDDLNRKKNDSFKPRLINGKMDFANWNSVLTSNYYRNNSIWIGFHLLS